MVFLLLTEIELLLQRSPYHIDPIIIDVPGLMPPPFLLHYHFYQLSIVPFTYVVFITRLVTFVQLEIQAIRII